MKSSESPADARRLPDAADGEAARRRRDHELTMSERLERAHELCAQLARLAPIEAKRPG